MLAHEDGAGTGTRAGGRGATRAGHGAHGIAQRQISARRLVASSGFRVLLTLVGVLLLHRVFARPQVLVSRDRAYDPRRAEHLSGNLFYWIGGAILFSTARTRVAIQHSVPPRRTFPAMGATSRFLTFRVKLPVGGVGSLEALSNIGDISGDGKIISSIF